MADRGSQDHRELVFCYNCENEWHRDEHGLECPLCHSEIVEIIDARNDPRIDHIDLTRDNDSVDESRPPASSSPPEHTMHYHSPWAHGVPDPDEPDIEHVAFSPAPGIRFESYRSSSPLNRRGNHPNDAFGALFQSFATMFNQPQDPHSDTPNIPHSPLHPNGPFPGGHRNHFTATARVVPVGDGNNMNQSIHNIHNIMQTMLQSMQANAVHNNPHGQHRAQAEGNPFEFLNQALAQLRNPAGAAHGDVVYSEEALDRIISQMMDQAGASSAPGPASQAAIAGLPKKPADKSMMGSDGKAECSVCMETVNIGDQVTVLPCKHWFHGECVGAWLKEHDTCPHCRQGIMPKEGDEEAPRSPEQAPRHSQNPFSPSMAGPRIFFGGRPQQPPHQPQARTGPGLPNHVQQMPPGAFTQPGMQYPYVPGGYSTYPEPRLFQPPQAPGPPSPSRSGAGLTPPSQGLQPPGFVPPLQQHQSGRSSQSRRPSSARGSTHSSNGEGTSSSGGSRVAEWFRNLRGGSNSGS